MCASRMLEQASRSSKLSIKPDIIHFALINLIRTPSLQYKLDTQNEGNRQQQKNLDRFKKNDKKTHDYSINRRIVYANYINPDSIITYSTLI